MYIHPPERKFREPIDALLKIADILYFFKKGEIDEGSAKRKITFLKVVAKNRFKEDEEAIEMISKEVDYAKELLNELGTLAYEKYIEHLKKEHPKAIEKLEKQAKSSLMAFLK